MWIGCVFLAVLAVSHFGGVAYVDSLICISVLVFGGHLITLDDDLKGGWSNPDGDRSIVYGSLIELGVKLIVLVGLISSLFIFPEVRQWGASP